jgi:hypothetical protein
MKEKYTNMHSLATITVMMVLAGSAYAQQSAYGQCMCS